MPERNRYEALREAHRKVEEANEKAAESPAATTETTEQSELEGEPAPVRPMKVAVGSAGGPRSGGMQAQQAFANQRVKAASQPRQFQVAQTGASQPTPQQQLESDEAWRAAHDQKLAEMRASGRYAGWEIRHYGQTQENYRLVRMNEQAARESQNTKTSEQIQPNDGSETMSVDTSNPQAEETAEQEAQQQAEAEQVQKQEAEQQQPEIEQQPEPEQEQQEEDQEMEMEM